ncbi:acyl-CoA dehydrogenase family protein [[Mycobacterium] burgundiense]|uniref:Acyl-CoA dehydrogenase family protein n=1 Tax=[Mycobacterium] burgundiense TaxID=3064286 RepID=A0ABM9LHX7_9MYCO|nr:acyl-CoA dehydrogenase family protein [Mycolicibacterium sp. MU0053]CAJ1499278.1 acyl-CoA dehydrogenase family protein [Mycolicibacterium sp. MU0053]
MTFSFEPDPEFANELEWIDEFVREEVEPIDLFVADPWNVHDELRNALIVPLQEQVKERKLWACHLGPELGGPGFGQVKLGLMNERLGRSLAAPIVFGCQAPDSGNSEILAHFGTDEQKERYLEPLLAGRIVSCFAMTEPQGGSDPEVLTTSAALDGDSWVINGEKWFASSAHAASFFIVMALTDPDGPAYKRHSMFVVPAETPGIEHVRNVDGHHGYLRFHDVRVPADHVLGGRGEAFVVAQTRLGGGRIHHAMRTVGLVRHNFDLMCRRALSRTTGGEQLARKQLVQAAIADSWCEIESFRLLVLQTAWKIDKYQDYKRVRGDISAVKTLMPRVLNNVASRALQIHGSIGVSEEMPFMTAVRDSYVMALADGPTEVHQVNLAKAILRGYTADTDVFPDYHLIRRREQAEAKFADVLARHGVSAQTNS